MQFTPAEPPPIRATNVVGTEAGTAYRERRPTVLLAMDKFKGTLDARQVCRELSDGVRQADSELVAESLPIADGGDGSVAAALRAGFQPHTVRARGPLGRLVDATVAVNGAVAVVEVAEICGLRMAAGKGNGPLTTTSYGVGQLIEAALGLGCTTLVLGLGGSATVDGGTGMLAALGARFTGSDGKELPPGGGSLVRLDAADIANARNRLHGIRLVLATDVDNPLLGADGAAHVYGPQKGARPDEVRTLEAGLVRLVATLGPSAATLARAEGAGAAGGLGFAGLLLGGEMRQGADFFLDLLGFDAALAAASLVITGEGRIDHQTLRGKAPTRVALRAHRAGVATIAVTGMCTLSAAELRSAGIGSVVSLMEIDQRCATDPDLTARLLRKVGEDLANAATPRQIRTTPRTEGDRR